MDTCPENIWEETNGGWPVWQQVAHAVAVLNFLILEKEDDQFLPAPCDINTLMLKEQGKSPVTRAAMGHGVVAGISTGANVRAALDIAARPEMRGKNIVTFACDTGERYMSTSLFNA